MRIIRGDTIIEVLLATTIFSFVAISSMVIINNNTNNLEANLELTMARTEVDAQAEAIRFIHDAYVAENDFAFTGGSSALATRSPYHRLWQRLTNNTTDAAPGLLSASPTPTARMSCNDYYEGENSIYAANRHAYAINTRSLATATNQTDSNWFTLTNLNRVIVPATSPTDSNNKFAQATTYPRVIYGNTSNDNSSESLISDNSTEVQSVQGIWVITVPQQDSVATSSAPEYYDFHIYTCWYGPGRETPTTIGTILRLYNPRYRS